MTKKKRERANLQSPPASVPVAASAAAKESDVLFDNSQFRQAFSALSPEEQERFKQMGENMYGSNSNMGGGSIEMVNEKGEVMPSSKPNVDPDLLKEAGEYIIMSIRSGQHPSTLEENEKEILKQVIGEKWYEDFGYVVQDLEDMVTIL